MYNIDVSMLEEALSDKTKAVMIAHTLGNPFDLKVVSASPYCLSKRCPQRLSHPDGHTQSRPQSRKERIHLFKRALSGFPTTVAPVIQYGAVPVFVDVTIPQYNIDVKKASLHYGKFRNTLLPDPGSVLLPAVLFFRSYASPVLRKKRGRISPG